MHGRNESNGRIASRDRVNEVSVYSYRLFRLLPEATLPNRDSGPQITHRRQPVEVSAVERSAPLAIGALPSPVVSDALKLAEDLGFAGY